MTDATHNPKSTYGNATAKPAGESIEHVTEVVTGKPENPSGRQPTGKRALAGQVRNWSTKTSGAVAVNPITRDLAKCRRAFTPVSKKGIWQPQITSKNFQNLNRTPLH